MVTTEERTPQRSATRQFEVQQVSQRVEEYLTVIGTEKSGNPRPANRPAYAAELQMLPSDAERSNGTPSFGHLTISTADGELTAGMRPGQTVRVTLEWEDAGAPVPQAPHRAAELRGTPLRGAP